MLVGVIYRSKEVEILGIELVTSRELFGQAIYCPLCRKELKGWSEGCTVFHLYCDHCGIAITVANTNILEDKDLSDLEAKLLSLFDEISSRW